MSTSSKVEIKVKNTIIKMSLAATLTFGIVSSGNAQFFPNIGSRDSGAAMFGAVMAVTMNTIIQKLSEEERSKRQSALQRAARSGDAEWQSSGRSGKRAHYRKVGSAKESDGKKCQKVEEVITLPDGKQGKSTETVCF